ncbi:MAG TPA: PA0069 family radical SAM protein [Micropepsaceae bacterium]|nr:PA0069 family radical SAM protein [Micropepsaceae bacterium]
MLRFVLVLFALASYLQVMQKSGSADISGRGARSNESSRYDREKRTEFDDGWDIPEDVPRLRTEIIRDATRQIITRNTSPDISFNQSINPYRGCEHGCIYCFARPTHAYLGMSPGLDFESKLFVKPEAARLLAEELRHPSYKPQIIAIGTNTDPYQPVERELRVMRSVLTVLWEFRHPVSVVTKSALIVRDLDILGPMAGEGLTKVFLSITTLDRRLARIMEPRAATPEKRLHALRELAGAGVPCGVMTAPMIPALNDAEMEDLLAAAATAGATEAGYTLLRLPFEIKDLFREWLESELPDRARHVMSLIRSMRGGKDYDSEWGKRMTGTGPYAELMAQRFRLAVSRLGLNRQRARLDCTKFRPPPQAGDQLGLFG